jgi:hypothetical protein
MEPAPADADSSCVQQAGACTCPHGTTAHLTIVARAADGREVAIDQSAVSWASSDPATVDVSAVASGGADIEAKRDWFDANNGTEPSATVTASYGGLRASASVTVVVDAHGVWNAVLDNGFTYTLSLAQSGRSVTDRATHYGGQVAGDALSLSISGFTVNAAFTSRTAVSGTYAGPGGLAGTLTCTRP